MILLISHIMTHISDQILDGITFLFYFLHHRISIETSTNPPNIVYLGTRNKYIYRIDNANVGDPSLNHHLPTGSTAYCSDIAINPLDADEIMVIYSNYSVYSVFHSTDGGASFEKVAGNLEQNPSGSGNGPRVEQLK